MPTGFTIPVAETMVVSSKVSINETLSEPVASQLTPSQKFKTLCTSKPKTLPLLKLPSSKTKPGSSVPYGLPSSPNSVSKRKPPLVNAIPVSTAITPSSKTESTSPACACGSAYAEVANTPKNAATTILFIMINTFYWLIFFGSNCEKYRRRTHSYFGVLLQGLFRKRYPWHITAYIITQFRCDTTYHLCDTSTKYEHFIVWGYFCFLLGVGGWTD